MVPPKPAMRTSPLPFRISGMVVCSGHAAWAAAGRMNGAARPAPRRPSVVRRPNVIERCLLMSLPAFLFLDRSVRQEIVSELLVLVRLAHQAAILQGGHQPVLDLGQRAAV